MTQQQVDGMADAVRAGIEQMPYNQMLGVRVVDMSDGRARGLLPSRPEVSNHVGSMHAGAQFSLAEATSGAAAASAFLDLLATGAATPLAQGVDLTYRRPAVGDVTAEAQVTAADNARVRAELQTLGRARFTVAVRLVDSEGTLATEATVRWYVRMNPS